MDISIIGAALQVLAYIVADAVFEGCKRVGVAGSVQLGHIGLCEVLVFVADIEWGIYKTDVNGQLQRSEYGGNEVDKGARLAGAGVV